MVTEEEYNRAKEQHDAAQDTINLYHREKQERFDDRLKNNPVFTQDELFYSAHSYCTCGHGIAYPKDCGPGHYWDCSAILMGIANTDIEHVGQMPFSMYKIQGESDRMGSTRDKVRPSKEPA